MCLFSFVLYLTHALITNEIVSQITPIFYVSRDISVLYNQGRNLKKNIGVAQVNVIFLKLNFDQITIVNSEIIGFAQATWATKGVTPLYIMCGSLTSNVFL